MYTIILRLLSFVSLNLMGRQALYFGFPCQRSLINRFCGSLGPSLRRIWLFMSLCVCKPRDLFMRLS